MNYYNLPEPSGWQIDPQTGERFRMVGNIKEFEMKVCVDGVEIPQSQLAAHNARMKEAAERRRQEENEALQKAPKWTCPILPGQHETCMGGQCALFHESRCTLTKICDRPATRETKGKKCPLNTYKLACTERCVMYSNGCKLTSI